MTSKVCLTEYFIETNNLSEKIIAKIKSGNCSDIFEGICKLCGDSIIIDYIYFKHFATNSTYDLITKVITKNIDIILETESTFTVHINMKSLSIVDVDKHITYMQYISNHLKEKYHKKLLKCHIYNASYIFKNIYNIISAFIDKETQDKIHLVKNT
jgi:hypothetical protein